MFNSRIYLIAVVEMGGEGEKYVVEGPLLRKQTKDKRNQCSFMIDRLSLTQQFITDFRRIGWLAKLIF